jgi:hypothetical protein
MCMCMYVCVPGHLGDEQVDEQDVGEGEEDHEDQSAEQEVVLWYRV